MTVSTGNGRKGKKKDLLSLRERMRKTAKKSVLSRPKGKGSLGSKGGGTTQYFTEENGGVKLQ